MWASGGSSLFANFALIGIGYIFGKVQFLPTILQIFAELRALSNFEKGIMALMFGSSITFYLLLILLPLDKIARMESEKNVDSPTTSFRKELRRRGSYSMNFVNDIRSHVLAQTS